MASLNQKVLTFRPSSLCICDQHTTGQVRGGRSEFLMKCPEHLFITVNQLNRKSTTRKTNDQIWRRVLGVNLYKPFFAEKFCVFLERM